MKCSIFRLQTDASRLSREKKDYLERLFLKKKWFRNAVIASKDLYAFDYKTKTVKGKKQEGRTLSFNGALSVAEDYDRLRCGSSVKVDLCSQSDQRLCEYDTEMPCFNRKVWLSVI
ncbi:MAG: hypothetical protein LBO67_09145 [Spirochaetaceae bacterium]|jgi:hypothetical protein|nr:hypothetical protein [Spirochaetaceae bacterium]